MKKHKTNYWILLTITVVASVVAIYLLKEGEIPTVSSLTAKQNVTNTQTNEVVEMKEVRVGDMVLSVPENLKIKEVAKDFLSIEIDGYYKNISKPDHHSNVLEIDVVFLPNVNENSSSLEDWFNYNDPSTEKTSASYEYTEPKTINNFVYLESLYQAPTSKYSSNFYDVVFNYFGNKQDIYQIVFYKKSGNQKIVLTKEEEKSIQNYEKIVDQILSSIRFVD